MTNERTKLNPGSVTVWLCGLTNGLTGMLQPGRRVGLCSIIIAAAIPSPGATSHVMQSVHMCRDV